MTKQHRNRQGHRFGEPTNKAEFSISLYTFNGVIAGFIPVAAGGTWDDSKFNHAGPIHNHGLLVWANPDHLDAPYGTVFNGKFFRATSHHTLFGDSADGGKLPYCDECSEIVQNYVWPCKEGQDATS
jgi:hypothetical protein